MKIRKQDVVLENSWIEGRGGTLESQSEKVSLRMFEPKPG